MTGARRTPPPEPPGLVNVTRLAAETSVRLKTLPWPAYLCGIWVGTSKLSIYYRDHLPPTARSVLDRSLAQIRPALPDPSRWDRHVADELEATWDEIAKRNPGRFHSGINRAIRTLRQVLGELSGLAPRYTAATNFIYMAWFMEAAFPEYQTRGFRRLSRVYAEPDSFLGQQMLNLNKLCEILETYVQNERELQPEHIAQEIYGDRTLTYANNQ
jgi:hypothetical protein